MHCNLLIFIVRSARRCGGRAGTVLRMETRVAQQLLLVVLGLLSISSVRATTTAHGCTCVTSCGYDFTSGYDWCKTAGSCGTYYEPLFGSKCVPCCEISRRVRNNIINVYPTQLLLRSVRLFVGMDVQQLVRPDSYNALPAGSKCGHLHWLRGLRGQQRQYRPRGVLFGCRAIERLADADVRS